MSSVHYEFVSNHRTGWMHSVSCDMPSCKAKVEREGPPPRNENEGGLTTRFSTGAFVGWMSVRTYVARGGDTVDVNLDMCPACATVLMDSWVAKGLDFTVGGEKTVYLDANAQPVESESVLLGEPMCVWKIDGPGVRPCRRPRGHEGPCLLVGQPDRWECPVCVPWRDDMSETNPPLVYTQRALEHHALVQHGVLRGDDGEWIVRVGQRWASGSHEHGVEAVARSTALEALEAIVS